MRPTLHPLLRLVLIFCGALLCISPAVAADGILKVKSTVANAEVWLDGKNAGPVPLTQFLPPGSHNVRVVADFHDPYVRKVEIQEGKTVELNAALTPGNGTVEFVGPGGARLEIDARDRGVIPTRLSDIAPGSHTYRVTAPKAEPVTGTLSVVRGKNYLIEIALSSSAGVFIVETKPEGASVVLDGKAVGTTPLRLEGVPLGQHGVLVTHPERAAVARTVDTSDGSRGEVLVTLPKSGATLKVTTGSPDATVLLNGAPLGAGNFVKFGPIEKGRAQLSVVDGDARVNETITLPGAGTLLYRRSGEELAKQKPLTQRWGFWAAVGGGVAAGTGVSIATAVALQPEPLPSGDTVVNLP